MGAAGAKTGAVAAKAGATGAKAGAVGGKGKLGAMAKNMGKDMAMDAGASIASSAASLPGKVVSGIGNAVKKAASSTVKDETTPIQAESYRNHSFADSYQEVIALEEARAKTREEANAKLKAHQAAMKAGKTEDSPYFGKKETKQTGLRPTHGDGTLVKKGETRRNLQHGGEVDEKDKKEAGEFPMTPSDKKINAKIDKYMNK